MSAAVLGALPVAGCASDSPQAAVCDSLTAVQNSARHVRETKVAENGLNQLRTNLVQLRTDVQQLIHNAKTQWAPQAQAIQSSLDQVGSAVNAARTAPSATAFDAVRQALAALENSVKALGDAMRGAC